MGGVTLVLVAVIVFLGVEALPGDACTAYLGRDAALETRLANCRRDFGLNEPAYERFFAWAGGALQGDLGISLRRNKPISEVVGF